MRQPLPVGVANHEIKDKKFNPPSESSISTLLNCREKLDRIGKSSPLPLLPALGYRAVMESNRLPRFKRSLNVGPMQLTERDREIIRFVYRHRFLRSPHILALISGSAQQTLRRLQLLYHHGYLERPRQQIERYDRGGSRHMVYGVGDKGAALLKPASGGSIKKLRLGEKNRSVGRVYLEHALLVSDFLVALDLCCRQSGHVLLLAGHELLSSPNEKFKWSVKTKAGRKLGIIPDRVFGLEFKRPTGELDRAFFFLEADRGTMPVMRERLSQTSFFRKMLAYEATWAQSIHQKRFGFHRFRVLTVTASAERVKSLLSACSQLDRGQGLFLFADRTILERPEYLLSSVWQSGRSGEAATLLD